MAGLAVKIDQVAALRNARKSQFPDPVTAATMAELAERMVLSSICGWTANTLMTGMFVFYAVSFRPNSSWKWPRPPKWSAWHLDIKPDLVTLVPEKREEFTADGGLDLIVHRSDISDTVATLQNSGIPVGLLVDPDPEQIKLAHKIGASLVEINTATYCDAKTAQKRHQAFLNIVDAVKLAHKLKFSVKAGRGLCYKTVKVFKNIEEIDEFSIGHSIISRAVLMGMQAAVADMRKLILAL